MNVNDKKQEVALSNVERFILTFKCQPPKMIKHIQTIRWEHRQLHTEKLNHEKSGYYFLIFGK